MQETILLSIPLSELQTLIIDSVNACLDVRKPEQPPKPSGYITRKQAAEQLHITLQTLHTWIKQGKLQSYHIGGKTLLKANEVSQAVKPVSYNLATIKGGAI